MARGRYIDAKTLARLEAADKFTANLHFMMTLGLFESISMRSPKGKETRAWLGKSMMPWEDLRYPEPHEKENP